MNSENILHEELVVFKILSAYISSENSKISNLKDEEKSLELIIAELEEKLSSLTSVIDEDKYVFSPFHNEEINERNVEEINDQLALYNEKKSGILEQIEISEKRIEEFSFILDFIKKVNSEYDIEKKKDDYLLNNNLNNDIKKDDTDNSNEQTVETSSLFKKLKFISSLLPADPLRAKTELNQVIRDN